MGPFIELSQALDLNHAIVLGTDGNLWLEQAPFGKVPPTRRQIDANVMEFLAIDTGNVLVLGTDGGLTVNYGWSRRRSARRHPSGI